MSKPSKKRRAPTNLQTCLKCSHDASVLPSSGHFAAALERAASAALFLGVTGALFSITCSGNGLAANSGKPLKPSLCVDLRSSLDGARIYSAPVETRSLRLVMLEESFVKRASTLGTCLHQKHGLVTDKPTASASEGTRLSFTCTGFPEARRCPAHNILLLQLLD